MKTTFWILGGKVTRLRRQPPVLSHPKKYSHISKRLQDGSSFINYFPNKETEFSRASEERHPSTQGNLLLHLLSQSFTTCMNSWVSKFYEVMITYLFVPSSVLQNYILITTFFVFK